MLSYLDKSNFLKVSALFYDEQSCEHQHLLGISRADLISDRLGANFGSLTRTAQNFRIREESHPLVYQSQRVDDLQIESRSAFLARNYLARVRKNGPIATSRTRHGGKTRDASLTQHARRFLNIVSLPRSFPSPFSAYVRSSNFRRFQWGLSMLAR